MIWAFLTVVLNTAAHVFLKKASVGGLMALLGQGAFWGYLFFQGFGLLTWAATLRKLPLSSGFAILALMYVTIPVCSALILKEKITGMQVFGYGLVISGVVVVACNMKS